MTMTLGKLLPVSVRLHVKCLLACVVLQSLAIPARSFASGEQYVVPELFTAEFDAQRYLDGQLFTSNGKSLEKVLTYLHLSRHFNEQHHRLFADYLQTPNQGNQEDGYAAWNESIGNTAPDLDHPLPQRRMTTDFASGNRTYTRQSYFVSCFDDAFLTATRTLNERTALYGAASIKLKRWLSAQIQVFGHCQDTDFNPPSDPEPAWTRLEQQDREYQIAAAYFYDTQYDEATRRFKLISADQDSPWAGISRYLVARSLAKKALIGKVNVQQNLLSALSILQELKADQSYLQKFPFILEQISYVKIQLDSQKFLHDTALLVETAPEQVSRSELVDFLFLLDHSNPAFPDANQAPLLKWLILARDASARSSQTIFREWLNNRSDHWQFLALERKTTAADAELVQQLNSAAALLRPDNPAHCALLAQTVNFLHMNSAYQQSALLARRMLNDKTGTLSIFQRNLISQVVAETSDWLSFPGLAQLKPAAVGIRYGKFLKTTPAELDRLTHHSPLFADATVMVINNFYTPKMLLQVLKKGNLSNYLQGQIAASAWIKALMLDDAATAQEIASIAKNFHPSNRDGFDRYLQSDNPRFEAAKLILESPGLSTEIPFGIGRNLTVYNEDRALGVRFPAEREGVGSEQNWWCGDIHYDSQYRRMAFPVAEWVAYAHSIVDNNPLFANASAEQKSEMSTLHAATQQSVSGFFGKIVVEYAKAHLDDPSVPKALHRVVFAGRYSCWSDAGEVSKAAFNLLHTHYPASPWAAKTPYWYE